MTKTAIGIDLGGTVIKGVLLREDGTVLREARRPMVDQGAQWKDDVRAMVQELKKETSNATTIGLSAPGLADAQNRSIAFLPGKLPGLEHFIWSDYIGQDVHVLNDAQSALMAEVAFGVAKGLKHVVLLTLGTGVGGGLLINGTLYQGLAQMAGHLGHMVVDAGSEVTGITGMPGSIEEAIGNASVPKRSLGQYASTKELLEHHRNGDPFATWLWLSSVRKLSLTIASLCHALSPELVVLSGGLTQAQGELMGPLERFLNLYEWQPGGKKTPVGIATFTDLAGAVGAAAYSLTK